MSFFIIARSMVTDFRIQPGTRTFSKFLTHHFSCDLMMSSLSFFSLFLFHLFFIGAQEQKNPKSPSLDELKLTYGCYCGPGHSCLVPINNIDKVCKQHDACYVKRGRANCACERKFIQTMPAAIQTTSDKKGKMIGNMAIAFFSATPCICKTCRRRRGKMACRSKLVPNQRFCSENV